MQNEDIQKQRRFRYRAAKQRKGFEMARDQKLTVKIEGSLLVWLWKEKRRRERSIAWIVNQAITQYMNRIEGNITKKSTESDAPEPV